MSQMAALLISFLILHGLLGKMASLRTVFAKKIHAGVLRQLTGIWDRHELIEKFGHHDEEYYFSASHRQIFKARRLTRWIFGNMWFEIVIVAALLYMAMGNSLGSELTQTMIVAIGAVYVVISGILTFKQSKRSKAQFEEEIDVLRQKRMTRFQKAQKK